MILNGSMSDSAWCCGVVRAAAPAVSPLYRDLRRRFEILQDINQPQKYQVIRVETFTTTTYTVDRDSFVPSGTPFPLCSTYYPPRLKHARGTHSLRSLCGFRMALRGYNRQSIVAVKGKILVSVIRFSSYRVASIQRLLYLLAVFCSLSGQDSPFRRSSPWSITAILSVLSRVARRLDRVEKSSTALQLYHRS